MKFSVLAIDYDGTIAEHGVVDPDVRAALAEARASGVTVVLVTGRILDDLRRVAGDLHFADAVVAENGAIIEFPASGYSAVLGRPPAPGLLEGLRRDGIPFDTGRAVVEADSADAPEILAIIRRLEQPLVLLFNRGRVMVLPQGISKGSGLREVLAILRLSPRNALAIGDAENDHELLEVCEVGVAVGWGSDALKASADYVLRGDGPRAVAAYVRDLLGQRQLPVTAKTRRRLLLGHTDEGRALELAEKGRNVLVAGDPKSGKSWVTGLICEQLILHGYSMCILDPEGDYTSLAALPRVVVLGGVDPLPRPRDLLRVLRYPDVSIVIDLSQTPHPEKLDYLHTLLPAVATLRRHTGLPHRIVVDEAHYFLHGPDVRHLLDLELNGYTLVTYRASQLNRDLLAASQAIIVTCESDPHEVRALFELCTACNGSGDPAEWERLLGSLALGEAVALPMTEEAGGEVRRIRLAPRLTPHVRHLAKYVDIPVPNGRAFVFWHNGRLTGQRARTLREFTLALSEAPPAALAGHVRRGDFSRWIAEVFGDYPLARTVRRLEEDYRAGRLPDVAPAVGDSIRQRYQFVERVSHEPSREKREDVQSR